MNSPRILVTTVGSYPAPDWFVVYPNEQSLFDATRVIFAIQREMGVDPLMGSCTGLTLITLKLMA